MDINIIQCNIHNRFDIEVIDSRTGEIKEKAKAYNMVLDNLWHYLIETSTAFGTAIQYGSGTGTISVSDTSLFNRLNGINVTQDSLTCDYINKVVTRRCHINLALSTSVDANITEVGLAAGTGNGTLTTHAMLQDMNGNPISIHKTEFDIINIYATIYCHWNCDSSDSIIFYPRSSLQQMLTGQTNNFSTFKMGAGLSKILNYNIKTWSRNNDLANKRILYTMPRYTQAEGNISGIEFLIASQYFDGLAIKKGTNSWSGFNIVNEAVGTGDGTTTKFNTKFKYPYNATVYVNGVAASNVTVRKALNTKSDLTLLPIDKDSSTDSNLIYAPISIESTGAIGGKTYYNPDYNDTGFERLVVNPSQSYADGMTFYISNDLVNWDTYSKGYTSGTNTFTIPSEYQHYKYFRLQWQEIATKGNHTFYNTSDGYNIIFDTAPANGDVITIDYTTDCIPKDEDHVLDATVTFRFGNYTPTP